MSSAPRLHPVLAASVAIGLSFLLAFVLLPSVGASIEGIAIRVWPAGGTAVDPSPVLWIPAGDATDASATLRHELAQAIDRISHDGARAILLTVPLRNASDGTDLNRVRTFLNQPSDAAMRDRLASWERELDHDLELETALQRAGNVVLWDDPAHPTLERFAGAARLLARDPSVLTDTEDHRDNAEDALYLATTDQAAVPSLALAGWLAVQDRLPRGKTVPVDTLQQAAEPLGIGASGLWIARIDAGVARDPVGATALTLAHLATAPRGTFKDRVVVIGSGPASQLTTGGRLALGAATRERILSLLDHRFFIHPPALGLWRVALMAVLIAWAAFVLPGRTRRRQWRAAALLVTALTAAELVVLAIAHLWLPLLISVMAVPLATAVMQWSLWPRARATDAYEAFEPLPLAPRSAAPRPTLAPDTTQPMKGDSSRAARGPSLDEISRALNARLQEPTKEEVTDLLLGKRQRPARPKLGRYELEREIGRGAMGTVYLGRDPRINRIVAIKAIPLVEEFNESDLAEARARFFREAEMAGQLRHPGIVTVYDAGEDDGIAWIAMEYLQGRILNQHALMDSLLPTATTLEIVARVADALDYAHEHHVIHRDVKPANIMIDNEARSVKLMDFGVARNSNTSSTRSGIVLGTPSFMSPEQLDGATMTGRSDIFALGITLFQLLTGQLPFRADSMTGLMNSIVHVPHPPLHTIRPDLPASIGAIIDKALAKNPEMRYAHAALMAEALRAAARELAA